MSNRQSLSARLVSLCAGRAWIVVILALVFVAVITVYTVRHFAMSTNTYMLLSPKLAWRMRESEFYAVFRQAGPPIVVVVDGQTPELADAAATALTDSLRNTRGQRDLIQPGVRANPMLKAHPNGSAHARVSALLRVPNTACGGSVVR